MNTTTVLRCGMVTDFENINQYGVIGPFILTTGTMPASQTGGMSPSWHNTGTEFNIFDGITGQFLVAIVNGTAPTFLGEDSHGNIIGYRTNSTDRIHVRTWLEARYPWNHRQLLILCWSIYVGPNMYLLNLSYCLELHAAFNFGFSLNTAYLWKNGVMWYNPIGAFLTV